MPRGQRRKSRPQLTLRKVIGRELTRRFRKKSVDPDNINQAAQISPEQVLGVLTPVASEFIRSAWDDSSFGSSGGSQSNRGLSRRSIQSSAPAILTLQPLRRSSKVRNEIFNVAMIPSISTSLRTIQLVPRRLHFKVERLHPRMLPVNH